MSDHGQPIGDWATKQKDLTEDERASLASLPGVRTLGDLRVVIDRGEVDKALAAKLKKALG